MGSKMCCKNCVHCECVDEDTFTCKFFLQRKAKGWMPTESAEREYCNNFEESKTEVVEENTLPNFLWLVVFILVFVCALYAILEYSGIINYLSGLI